MFAYTDETGHSGRNIFDKNEIFRLGSILSINDIRHPCESVIGPFVKRKGVERLHANQWQDHEIAELGQNILDTLDDGNKWNFNIMQIHKPYVAPTKLVDLIFDPGENSAVPGVWYWDEMHRHILCLMMDDALNFKAAKQFWTAYLADDIDGVICTLGEVESFISSAGYPKPFKSVVKEAFKFARKSPGSFTMNATRKRKGYQAHTPNVIAFTQLFQAIHEFSRDTGSKPEILFHDKQDEFRSELQDTYQCFGGVVIQDTCDGSWPDAILADYKIGELEILPSVDNAGLQAADLLLWVNQRSSDNAEINVLKDRLGSLESPYYIGRGMSELIVDIHMKQRAR
ncbi:DUF3800 domain-containing protein [Maribius pontilimi]|uniref:DUF3800 domain-containing protein n=1 Tax=Palleronia pontilimi TaxID=1964209 RepID=A0A934ILH1_9RHOB|nr:DUF3800 domain-containing protein [Palleronia pontilimi]MBJ3764204.1 DUF3800 domain-containing protein [Palleronia pontilimi]